MEKSSCKECRPFMNFLLGFLIGGITVGLTIGLFIYTGNVDDNLSDNFIRKINVSKDLVDTKDKVVIPGYDAETGSEIIIITDKNLTGDIIYTGTAYGDIGNNIIYTGSAYGDMGTAVR